MNKPLMKNLVGEFIASWLLGSIGLFMVFLAVILKGASLYEVGIAFGLLIAVVVYIIAPISGAHFNPAVTITLAIFKGFPKKWVLPFIVAQILGWFAGALTLYAWTGNAIVAHEAANHIIRGTMASQETAMIFQCFSPHPLFAAGFKWGANVVPTWLGILNEFLATMLLLVGVFAFIDEKNDFKPSVGLFPLVLGLLAGFLIILFSPLSMAAFNPARDFGPRIATWLLGWGKMAFPGPGAGVGGYWYIYWIGPILGAIAGGALWDKVLVRLIPQKEIPSEKASASEGKDKLSC